MIKKQKIVAIGGGTGLSRILRGLKKHPLDITAIVTVADDGGSSGMLRNELQIPPPGDIRNVLVALSDVEPMFEQLLQHRFKNGNGLNGHSLGNLLIAALTSITGDFVKGVAEMSRILNVNGNVLPAANQSIVLGAIMTDGTIVKGESTIRESDKKIKRVFLEPSNIAPLQESVEAIKQADLIVLGPGSLYTSVIPNILVPELAEEIQKAKAKKVYICNIMTEKGETDYFTAADHVKVLLDHGSSPFLDYILVNNKTIDQDILENYAREEAEPVLCDSKRCEALGIQVISDDLVSYDHQVIRHNEKVVSDWLVKLLPPNN
ncbi:uridine diphosphate-N-acetylglucosamine-binding protein YvcK [Terrilactibacillus sp. BCM23-1]|uniref:Gluconeogenesis factor n=1 Tax=Terrilactibacillus tamarindi TaxID=2599694 RepID=A0A6N8CS58_9BACI|nr:YvcK family protein [Terrilactibacillus tamarindi]MTT30816.1 uridine diphosphate-N-acetylglucosamine-binding protein YvcK [Terrilactibacillus tamarindi]